VADTRPAYQPPTGDEPLDAIELGLVQMWSDIVERRIRAKLVAEQRADPDDVVDHGQQTLRSGTGPNTQAKSAAAANASRATHLTKRQRDREGT